MFTKEDWNMRVYLSTRLGISPMRERVGVAVGHTLLVGGLPVH
jgi:hypothetical protein